MGASRHNCGIGFNGITWVLCAVCGGRVHLPGCTSKRNKRKDCCEARHQMLHEQGQKESGGLPMLGSHSNN